MNDEVKLLRKQLKSIDISGIEDKEVSETERLNYCAQISAVFPLLEKDIKKAMRDQILLNNEAEDLNKLTYGRGTCNGISLLYELWSAAKAEYESKIRDKEEFNKNEPIATLSI